MLSRVHKNRNMVRPGECKIMNVESEDMPDITAEEVKNAVK